MKTIFSVVALAGILASALLAEEDAGGGVANSGQELAKKLSNPISSLISVPLQSNYDSGYGPTDGNRLLLNIQPVIPVPLNKDWNLISRTILPVINQNHIARNSGSQFGLGDVVQSFFFSPSRPTKGGLIWGVGPVLMLPTGSDQMLSAKKWA
ncbi:MAG: transporter, partial [Armatimonadota bacterium]